MEIYGYTRVSSKEQNEDRQTHAMNELQIPPTNVYTVTIYGGSLTVNSGVTLAIQSGISADGLSQFRRYANG
jgi:hypothetical protein